MPSVRVIIPDDTTANSTPQTAEGVNEPVRGEVPIPGVPGGFVVDGSALMARTSGQPGAPFTEGAVSDDPLPPPQPTPEVTDTAVVTSEPARQEVSEADKQRKAIQDQLSAAQEELARKRAQLAEAMAKEAAGETDTTTDTTTTDTAPVSDFEEELRELHRQQDEVDAANQIKLEEIKATMQGQARAMITNIQNQYAVRKQQMQDINRRTLGAQRKLGFRSGRQRFASEIQTSILSAEEAAGIQRLAELDAQEQQLILQAEMAATENDFKLLAESMSLARDTHNRKVGMIKDLHSMAMDNERTLQDRLRFEQDQKKFELEMREIDPEIETQRTQGILDSITALAPEANFEEVDATEIFESINFDTSGNRVASVTLAQIEEVLQAKQKEADSPEIFEVLGTPSTGVWEVERDEETGQVKSQRRIIAPEDTGGSNAFDPFTDTEIRNVTRANLDETMTEEEIGIVLSLIPDSMLGEFAGEWETYAEEVFIETGEVPDPEIFARVWREENVGRQEDDIDALAAQFAQEVLAGGGIDLSDIEQ